MSECFPTFVASIRREGVRAPGDRRVPSVVARPRGAAWIYDSGLRDARIADAVPHIVAARKPA